MSYSIITPFIVPQKLFLRKRVNIGDGFIFQSIQKLLHPLKCEAVFPAKSPLSDEDIEKINATKFVVLAGANQLTDDFTIVPKMTLARLKTIQVPIIPFGVGFYGEAHRNSGMFQNTKDILLEMHSRIDYSSWRCPRTVAYLTRELPEVADKALMTGCPVMYGNRRPLSQSDLTASPVDISSVKRVAVTITDRAEFWEREQATLAFVAKKFKRAKKILSLHQNYFIFKEEFDFETFKKLATLELTGEHEKTPLMLRRLAQKRGYKVFIPQTVEDCFDFYKGIDLHIGSRLHAHLHFLSQYKPSFLTYVDDRCVGFSEALDFPICEVNRLESYLDYDFSRCQAKIEALNPVMTRFVSDIKATYA